MMREQEMKKRLVNEYKKKAKIVLKIKIEWKEQHQRN